MNEEEAQNERRLEEELDKAVRKSLISDLNILPKQQQEVFKRIYARGLIKYSFETLIENLPRLKITLALGVVKRLWLEVEQKEKEKQNAKQRD